ECLPLPAPAPSPKKNLFCAAHLLAAGLVWMLVAVVLFTSFFSNPSGLRAAGPIWSEALILLLAVCGGIAAFARRGMPGASRAFVRFLVFYTVILAAIYTVLPYKTPWSAAGFWHGAILLAGVGTAALADWLPGRRQKIAAGIVLLTGMAHLAAQAW